MHDTNGDLLQNATQDPGSEPSQASGDGFRGCNKLTWITYAKFLQQMNGACHFDSSVRARGDRAAIRLPGYSRLADLLRKRVSSPAKRGSRYETNCRYEITVTNRRR
ncbi:hypothetical protein RBSWK_03454 [Rhodopirellula baltica SWK14]|uniref:Uncharacterized protein n=1 Tax=Rhodopirellula baltica SWK14 TaxID=993516 RepID=L7CF30_RHOBT|nr:hypothetical protein RBSWK_03454 [Rhodopirellula baltica SWK14]